MIQPYVALLFISTVMAAVGFGQVGIGSAVLRGDINPSQTVICLSSLENVNISRDGRTGSRILIDQESVHVVSLAMPNPCLVVRRGLDGTRATWHKTGAYAWIISPVMLFQVRQK